MRAGPGERGWVVSTESNTPIHLIIKIILCQGHPFLSIHMEHQCLTFLRAQRDPATYFFPKFAGCQFSKHVPSKPLIMQPNYWPKPMNQTIITHLAISSLRSSVQNAVHIGKISLHHCRWGVSQRVLQLFTFGRGLHVTKNHLWTRLEFTLPWSTDQNFKP